jgi:hypothetical protein
MFFFVKVPCYMLLMVQTEANFARKSLPEYSSRQVLLQGIMGQNADMKVFGFKLAVIRGMTLHFQVKLQRVLDGQ